MRRRVYQRRVADRAMSKEKADREIAAMQAVLATLRQLAYSSATSTSGS